MQRKEFIQKSILSGVGAYITFSGTYRKVLLNQQQDIPIVDTHVHLWDLSDTDPPWVENSRFYFRNSPLNRNFLASDYQIATENYHVKKVVVVESSRSKAGPEQYMEEVDWIILQAQKEPRIQGIVAHLPLAEGEKVLPELEKLVSRKLVKGIRHGVNRELIGNSEFIKGIQLLSKFDLIFELQVTPSLMAEAMSLVRKCPNTKFILNHLCSPNIEEKELSPWREHISEYAKMDNVNCKMSGILVSADWNNWKADDLSPYIYHALNSFGTNRIIFGSDWPVMLLAGSFGDWLSVTKQMLSELNEDEKIRVFYQNAEKFYRL